ncbi:MAG: tRNA glutamyl-Q(34) synthetase GluQRS [Planctomycetota bacterium]|nr:tRNA glutamyl-Q(34) synthetase GluQRS [Planctomycetota bacterium]
MPPPSGAYIGRLAPAPTGSLHIGNARTFLLAWLRARQAGGRILLRLEDLDHPKVKAGAAGELYQDLAWLGLDWDAGPAQALAASHPGSLPAVPDPYVQSENLARYREALEQLYRQGKIYPCVCRRQELQLFQSAPHSEAEQREYRYPGHCRGRFPDLAAARAERSDGKVAWRFRLDSAELTCFQDAFAGYQESRLDAWSGDFLVGRETEAGYQLAVVVDDHQMGISEVVRGDDLLPSTHRQLVIYRALGFSPPRFCHFPLILGPDGRRLAKRHGDSRLSRLREKGVKPERLLGWLAWCSGWNQDWRREVSLAELVATADFSRLPPQPVVVDKNQLAELGF